MNESSLLHQITTRAIKLKYQIIIRVVYTANQYIYGNISEVKIHRGDFPNWKTAERIKYQVE